MRITDAELERVRIMLTDHTVWYVWRAGSDGSITWLGTEL